MKKVKCASLQIVDAIATTVEATFTKGLPSFSIVGLANSSIQESKERVKSALLINEFKFPPLKITINLSPSDVSKSGTQFDLPIALLIALYDKNVRMEDFFIFGELGLDGSLKHTSTLFAIVLSIAQQFPNSSILVPKQSVEFVKVIPNINIFAVDTLLDAIDFFLCEEKENYRIQNTDFDYPNICINGETFFYSTDFALDFNEVKGQQRAKKAALIAACGNHNILFEGSPGCGKSMISKRMQYILPPMSHSEILEKAKLNALEQTQPNFQPIRSYRAPHHTGTKASIFGGGSTNAKIGEIALANNGILFFDELPHYSKSTLEALREPLEDHQILISRVHSKTNYPTKFLFTAAMNPCPCGNLLSQSKECRCNENEIQRYKNRLSDPFLDRIDLYVVMNEVSSNDKQDISSQQLHQTVLDTFIIQKQRGQKELNGKLDDIQIKHYCILENDANMILENAIDQYKLSFRSVNKILKVSRTIADINKKEKIDSTSLLEALSFRKR